MINRRTRIVGSFEELIGTPFAGEVNALCWPRRLEGDFQEVFDRLRPPEGLTTIEDEDLRTLDLGPAGCIARDRLLADQALLRDAGLAPILDTITEYLRDERGGPVPTDVYSFHVDSAPVQADTYLCTYLGPASEGLMNEEAIRRVDVAETRAELLRTHSSVYGGSDDDAFTAYLAENCFDLHYVPRPGARPYPFGLHNVWRIAIAYPNCPVLPCIHRAPPQPPGTPPRMLLIS